MPTAGETVKIIESGGMDARLSALYGAEGAGLGAARARYAETLRAFAEYYGEREVALYGAPGRTELGGNHTDHNRGAVLAAAVNLDNSEAAAKNNDGVLRVRSKGFPGEDAVALGSLEVCEEEKNRSAALVRGVAAGIRQNGGIAGGLDVYTASDVLQGSGLSSSAAFEVCLGMCLNGEYNAGRFSPLQLARIGQYAENVYFGKPCGLMDQTACAVGGVVSIDFKDAENPEVKRIPFDLAASGYSLVITDTGGSHADLTPEYAAIRGEMAAVAGRYGAGALRDVPPRRVFEDLPALRERLGDRAVLRALHFYAESERAGLLAAALATGDFKGFLALILASGHSSFEYNQNAYVPGNPRRQGISLALALSQAVLEGGGAWRLQGGGFAGTVQAFVPRPLLSAYCERLSAAFGQGACHILTFREAGCVKV